MKIEEILIIKNAQENYGISTEDINQISRVPSLMPLPLRPSGVRGLCSVGGNVVSMVDLNLLLSMPKVDLDDHKSRVISLNDKLSSNTLLVSDVYNTVEVDQENIEYIQNENDPVIAIYKYEDMLVQVLSLEELFSKMNAVSIESKEVKAGKLKVKEVKEEDSSRFLIFSMANEKYALEIDYLQEIILADTEFTEIAGTPEEVLGLITLREELLLVVDLRTYYGFSSQKDDHNRILVISYDGKKIGLYIDAIIDIKNFLTRDIEVMDEQFGDAKIAGVIHDAESLISFFDHNVINSLFRENENYIDSSQEIQEETQEQLESREVIIFKLSDQEYAFDVESIDEIIDVVSSTQVAFTDESIEGIINIRGQIIPTVSLFHKLNITPVLNEDSKIIICNMEGTRIGFVVDSVSDILAVPLENIKEEREGYFESILYLDNGDRLVMSMDLEKILAKEPVDE